MPTHDTSPLSAGERIRTTVVLLAMAVASVSTWWWSSGPALADPYPIDGGPDGADHSFCFDPHRPMADAVRDRAMWTMNNDEGVEAQTTVDTVYKESCGPHTDVRFQQRPLEGNTLGYSPCVARVPGSAVCDRRDVQIDWTFIKAVSINDNFEARHTLCHEVGHTLGLFHYSNAFDNPDGFMVAPDNCMKSGAWDSGARWTRTYGPHHVAHIEAQF